MFFSDNLIIFLFYSFFLIFLILQSTISLFSSALHRADNLRVMQANMALVKEINALRPEVRRIRLSAKDDGSAPGQQNGYSRKSFYLFFF